jgi:hypothetical protein
MVRQAARDFYQPGRFVTFFGYEATHLNGKKGTRCGHRNVYHLEPEERIYNTDVHFPSRCTRDIETIEQLWGVLEGTGALVIPHGGVDWDLHRPGLERLVEVYSKWGSREYYGCDTPDPDIRPGRAVQDALARGYKLGFVGGSDTHCARPGDVGPGALIRHPSGLTAVYADELSREGIWQALLKRHTYVTTGEKILLYFSIDGKLMGEEYVAAGGLLVYIEVAGTDEIEAIELIRDGAVIHTEPGSGVCTRLSLQVAGPVTGTSYYYVRARQRNTSRAWSSPIWVRGNESL